MLRDKCNGESLSLRCNTLCLVLRKKMCKDSQLPKRLWFYLQRFLSP